jgi:CRP/FNR family transcriptional regulator, anaerobic regulatory protein
LRGASCQHRAEFGGIRPRRVHFLPRETAFAQEDLTTSFFNLLEGVMRLYKLLPDGRRQIVEFALPGDFLGLAISPHHTFSADAIGPVTVCRFPRVSFALFLKTNRASCAA